MILTRILSVSEQEFYDYLEKELKTSIQHCSKVELNTCDIKKGLKYSKHEDNTNARVDTLILNYERGKTMKLQITTLTDTITTSYDTSVGKDGLKVIFKQDIASFNRKKQHGFMHFFSEGIYLGRMSDTIYGIQERIIKQRET